jgi:tetratricopeptide (TPR) repeat protein
MEAVWIGFGIGFLFVLGVIGYATNVLTFADYMNRLLGRSPRTATERQVEEVRRALEEIQETLARPLLGTVQISTEALAEAAGPQTARLLKEALQLSEDGRHRDAIECLLEAFRRDLAPQEKIVLEVLLGASFLNLGDIKESIAHYMRALEAARAGARRWDVAVSLQSLGCALAEGGEFSQAEGAFREAIALFRELELKAEAGTSLANLGLVLLQQEKFDEAETELREALRINSQEGNSSGTTTALASFGLLQQARGNLQDALKFHFAAVNRYHEVGDRRSEAKVLGNIGTTYLNAGMPNDAEEFLQEALEIERAMEDVLGQGRQYGNLAIAAAQRQDWSTAKDHLKHAILLFEAAGALADVQKTKELLAQAEADERASGPR